MLANFLKQYLERFGIHYAWVMAGMAFLFSVVSSAVSSTPQVLIIPITTAYGWAIADVSLATAIMYFVVAAMCPFGAALMLKFGITKIVILAVALEVLGLTCTALAYEKWHLLFSIGLCLGVASGIIGLSLAATIAIRWFAARRGLVIGVLASAFAAGQLLFIPFMAWITVTYDWRMAVLPGIIGALLTGIFFLLFGKDWPSHLNIPAYGDKEIYKEPDGKAENFVQMSLSILAMAVKHPAFWILASTFFICGLTSSGIVGQHFIPFCADNNIGIVVASSYLAIMGIFNFFGTMGSGWLSDRYDNYLLLAIYYGLRGLSLLYLPYGDFSMYALLLWAIFFGLDFIATVPPTVRLTSQYFGTVNGPLVFGWIFAAHQFGSAFAAYGAGLSRDVFITYVPAFIVAGLSCFIATGLVMYFRSCNYLKA
jgi:MFS family permease